MAKQFQTMGGRRSRYWCGPGIFRETKKAPVRGFTGAVERSNSFLLNAKRRNQNVRATIKLDPGSPDILARIVSRKQDELSASKQPAAELRQLAESARSNRRDFAAALRSKRPAIISEIKKASPSRGVLIADFRPVELAQQYEKGGAAALSVLTDRDFFQGSSTISRPPAPPAICP